MAKMGRPPLPAKERQSRIIALRLTSAEYKKLETLAGKSGQSVSDYIRRTLGFKGK